MVTICIFLLENVVFSEREREMGRREELCTEVRKVSVVNERTLSLPPSLPAASLMPRTPGGLGGREVAGRGGEGLGPLGVNGREGWRCLPWRRRRRLSVAARVAADEGSGGQKRRRHGWSLSCLGVMTGAEVFMSRVGKGERVASQQSTF